MHAVLRATAIAALTSLASMVLASPEAGAADKKPVDIDLTTFIREPIGLFRRFDFDLSDHGDYTPSPAEGDTVTLHYSGTDENGHEFVNTFNTGKPITFTLGRLGDNYFAREYDKAPVDGVGKGWDKILRMMRKGDHVTLAMPPELAVLPGAPLLPQDSRLLYFKAKLIDVAYAQEAALKQAKEEMAARNVEAPADPMTFSQLGYQALYDNKDPQKAVQYFRWNAALFPRQGEVFESLGEGYLQLGDVERAIEAYEKALSMKKSDGAELVVLRLKADPRSLSWLQERALGAYQQKLAVTKPSN